MMMMGGCGFVGGYILGRGEGAGVVLEGGEWSR